MNENNENERFLTKQGIGLFKIDYEMDLGANVNSGDHAYHAGVIAYGSEEAQQTLNAFCVKNVAGFRGMKVSQMGFEGYCHAVSDNVRKQIIQGAVNEGIVAYVEADTKDEVVKENPKPEKVKKSIIKDKK